VAAARACDEMKGEDILILDLRELTQLTDCFVLCTGRSERQLKAIAKSVREALRAAGARPFGDEGDAPSGWILLDYVDVVVHVFSAQARDYYQLEMLWGDAPRIEWQEEN
jgi:ribosome-associated protein